MSGEARKRGFPVGLAVAGASVGLLLIVLLAVLMCGARRSRPKVPVRILVTELRLACANFRLMHERYPWAEVEDVTGGTAIDCRRVYVELRGLPGAKINKERRDYLGKLPDRFVKGGVVVDSWGRPLVFRVNAKNGEPVVWSYGRNGRDETNDGESPDPAKRPKTYYWFGKGGTGDDIVSD